MLWLASLFVLAALLTALSSFLTLANKDKFQCRLLEAEALARRQIWKPLQPEEVLQFVSNQINDQSTQHIQTKVFILQDSTNYDISLTNIDAVIK